MVGCKSENLKTGFSDSEIDGGRLTQDLQQAVRQLNNDGYDVVSVTPVASGSYRWKYEQAQGSTYGGGYGYGYGYSYTEGIIFVAQRSR